MPNFTGGQASGVTDPFRTAIQTLSIEKKQLHIDKIEALKDHQATLETLKREQAIAQELKMQLEWNTTLIDNLQRELQRLQAERASLQSSTSHISETPLNVYFHRTFWNQTFSFCAPHLTENSCGRCGPQWFLLNTTCYFHSKSASLPLRNWWDSRTDCATRGGNLTVIDNIEEQVSPLLLQNRPKEMAVKELFIWVYYCHLIYF